MARRRRKAGKTVKRRKRKVSAWIRHVQATYRKNKSKGYAHAMRAAKKTWHKKKKK